MYIFISLFVKGCNNSGFWLMGTCHGYLLCKDSIPGLEKQWTGLEACVHKLKTGTLHIHIRLQTFLSAHILYFSSTY